jgi:hypothetical protein
MKMCPKRSAGCKQIRYPIAGFVITGAEISGYISTDFVGVNALFKSTQ